MRNNTSLMLDQTSHDGVRRSVMDLPRKLADYQQSRRSNSNRGEKESVLDSIDVASRSNLGGTYNHNRASVESH
jgi:hypothetical protein